MLVTKSAIDIAVWFDGCEFRENALAPIPRSSVYDAYSDWCIQAGRPKLNRATFGKALLIAVPGTETVFKNFGFGRENRIPKRCYVFPPVDDLLDI